MGGCRSQSCITVYNGVLVTRYVVREPCHACGGRVMVDAPRCGGRIGGSGFVNPALAVVTVRGT